MATTVWRGQLTFGLVSIPVRLYRAARKERIRMHYVREAEPENRESEPDFEPAATGASASGEAEDEAPRPVSRVTQAFASPSDDDPVKRGQLLRGVEVAPDQYVTFTQHELQKVRKPTSRDMRIVRSVKLAEIDPVYFESSYYVAPESAGERAYALLFAALGKTGHVALAQVTMHGRDHVILVRPGKRGLLAHTMFHINEVRAESEYAAENSNVNAKELDVACAFVEAIAAPFDPGEFKDTYRGEIEALIAGKSIRNARAQSAPAAPPAPDIMDALRKSLELAKKPDAPQKRGPSKVTEIRSKRPKRKA